ncbi:MAG: OB-fold nucleic acid binding domain-containing protein, partial [Burkholderiales bacterium]
MTDSKKTQADAIGAQPSQTEERSNDLLDTNQVIEERRQKLKALRAKGNAYPNDFKRAHLAAELTEKYDETDRDSMDMKPVVVRVAGRMMLKRVMGKASFATVQDMSGQIQLYVTDSYPGKAEHEAFKHWDVGDIIGAEGVLFRTKTGELSVRADRVSLITKSLRPL